MKMVKNGLKLPRCSKIRGPNTWSKIDSRLSLLSSGKNTNKSNFKKNYSKNIYMKLQINLTLNLTIPIRMKKKRGWKLMDYLFWKVAERIKGWIIKTTKTKM